MDQDKSLRMYGHQISYTYVVGHSLPDAIRAYADYLGEKPCDIASEGWAEVRGDTVIKVRFEADDYAQKVKTADEWIQTQGRGFLCSAEF